MQLQKYRKPILHAAAVIAGGLIGCFVLLPLLLPFVLGYLLSYGAEPAVKALGNRTPLPRWARSGICVTALFAVLGLALWLTVRVLWTELLRLVQQLPELLRQLQPTLEELQGWLTGLARRAPQSLAGPTVRWINKVFADGDLFLQSLYGLLSGLVSGILTGLPKLVLTLITTLIATYMISAALPEVKVWLRTHLPETWVKGIRTVRQRVHTALGGWLKAQFKLLLLVFGLLTLGLWLLGVEFPLLFGGIIAMLDALPVLGTGTVLIPWALISFLQGSNSMGFGLLTLYAVTALVRTALEPRLVGRQLGLPPLATLVAFYVGFRLFGILGMILLPLLAILVKQFVTLNQPAGSSKSSAAPPG